MPFQTIAEGHISPSREARVVRSHRPVEVEDEMSVRRRALEIATSDKPLARLAALLVSISRNNSYEGRDPRQLPDTLTSGFIADLLGIDIGSLAALLVDLRRRGLIDSDPSSALLLKDLDGLEMLADA
jgi:CRP/FNR family transcriptional regulator